MSNKADFRTERADVRSQKQAWGLDMKGMYSRWRTSSHIPAVRKIYA